MKRIFNILLFSLCFCATAVAQKLSEFTVVSFEEKPFDTAARDERYKIVDGNGDLFSIIKLVSNNAGDDLRAYSFDFGLCESRVKQVDGEVWVYVQRNAMRATIRRDGYKTVKYELNTTVQPGKVYEMVLTADALPVYREILQFNIKPQGVKATVMYKSTAPGAQFQLFGMTDDEGAVAKSIELGSYIYEIHTENYHKSEGRVELKENKGIHVENVTLRSISSASDVTKEFSILQFNVSPSNATTTVMYKSETPGAQLQFFGMTDGNGIVAKSVEPGSYIYEAYSDNYHKSEGRVVLAESDETYMENIVLRPKFSMLTLEAGEGVDIYIDNEKVGTGSWHGSLNAGTYSVECRKENHKSVSESITVVDSCDRTINLKSPVPITGTLTMISKPLAANITVDGKDCGITPITIENLLIGEHTVIVSKENYKSDTCVVNITENGILEKSVSLTNIIHMTITTKPVGAKLYINEEYVGTTPYNTDLFAGDYDLLMEKEGYRNFVDRVHLEGTEFNTKYKLKCQYKQKYGVYLEPAVQCIKNLGVGLNVGFYSNNFNMELFGTYFLDKTPVYINYTDGKESLEEIPTILHMGGKIGYGVILGRRFRITPQVGAGVVVMQSKNVLCNAVTLLGALRMECAISRYFGISLTPEYVYAMKKGEVYDKLSQVASSLKGCEGFGLRVGFHLY